MAGQKPMLTTTTIMTREGLTLTIGTVLQGAGRRPLKMGGLDDQSLPQIRFTRKRQDEQAAH